MTYDSGGLYIDLEHLEAFGENTARSLSGLEHVSGKRSAGRLRRDLETLRRLRAGLRGRFAGEAHIPQAAEWLLDNWYLAQREGQCAARDLERAGRLRGMEGTALILALSRALIRSGLGAVEEERCEIFLTGFQKVTTLDRRELILFLAGLRAAAIGELAALYACLSGSEEGEAAQAAGRLFTSLRLLSSLDLSDMLERVDRTENILREDPAGVYPLMDERTRDSYRRQVSKLAKACATQEYLVAMRALRMARDGENKRAHVGYWLFESPLGGKKKARNGGGYIAVLVLVTLFLTLLAGFLTRSLLAALLLLVPVSELVKTMADCAVLRFTPPRLVPRLELRDGIPPEGRTLCVVSAMLSDNGAGPALARKLEEYRLANRDAGSNLLFGILADLPEAAEKITPQDAERVDSAVSAIDGLNKKYGGGFYLLARERRYDPANKKYMGWERKRGAVLELARLLRGAEDDPEKGVRCLCGSALGLRGARYILTLDADTRLCPGTARELAGAMLHPLNAPAVDGKRRAVVAGHGVIHPRMAVELSAATASDFARVFAGQGGTDPYGSTVGELYQDAFDRGGFAGKGIIDVDAFLACCDNRFPENAVLSHDALEGAFLRGAYMGDVELCDGYPASPLSWYKRAHRWTRGDWQNLPWLCDKGLRDLDKWKLFDSARRSLVAPMTFAAVFSGFLMPSGALGMAALAALFVALSQLFVTAAGAMLRPEEESRTRYHSTVVHGVGGALLRVGIRLILLPYDAWVHASAVAVALWRMLISRKNLLSWTTAAQSDAYALKKGGALSHFAVMWFSVLAGIFALAFSAAVIGRAAGLIWLFGPLCAMSLGKSRRRAHPPHRREREYLLGCAREIWGYFAAFCTQEENWLPPDNWQERPPVGLAHRTSPTNIGLCLLSALCALDLKLIPETEAMAFLDRLLGSVEALPKWKGHLYNWYDTRSMRPLPPLYVSTVDSGNLAGCLIVLREGLLEYGREDLAGRVQKLLEPMDFAPLYDRRRRLFYIGLDLSAGKPSKGWYDLLASEARLAGFIAIAKGDVERRHWRRLSRALVQKDGFRGMASWTGTMFEYLMPELIMPCYADSLLYESARFCLYVQKRRVPPGRPWGVSESAFYTLDPALNYRYKAHGCAALALKRGMDAELVVSPYSSFLALGLDCPGAVRNLKRMEALNARGRFGFWEALDFTPSRCTEGDFGLVRCAMAHHLGMSLVCVANCLTEGLCQRRFMRDPAMSAFRGLLEEKVPVGGLILRRDSAEPPEKPRRSAMELWRETGVAVNYETPACCLLSNGIYTATLTSSGLCFARSGGVLPYSSPRSQLGDGHGVELLLTGPAPISLLPEPGNDMEYAWDFTFTEGKISASGRGIASEVCLSLSPDVPGELRRISVRPQGKTALPVSGLSMGFSPALAFADDYADHPAFYRLGLYAYLKGGALMVRRVARGALGACYLCLASDRAMTVSSGGRPVPMWLSHEPVTAAWSLPAEGAALRVALCLGATEEAAYSGAFRALAGTESSAFTPAYASLLGLDAREAAQAEKLCRTLLFPRVCGDGGGKAFLWEKGISGDLPILCAEAFGEKGEARAASLIRQHALLSACGPKSDLVLVTDDGGSYDRPRASALGEHLRALGLEASLGARGGVHFVDRGADVRGLFDRANAVAEEDGRLRPPPAEARDALLAPGGPKAPGEDRPVSFRWNGDGSFALLTNGGLPPRAWGNMLTNGAFSYFATERGTGFMWYKNARENRMDPWINDPLGEGGPESLCLLAGGERVSLFAARDGRDTRVTFDLGAAAWEKRVGDTLVTLTAFVPAETAARVLLVTFSGAPLPPGAVLEWHADLQLASDARDACHVRTEYESGVLRAENPRSPYPDRLFTAVFSQIPGGFTCDRFSWLRGEMDGKAGTGLWPCFCARFEARETLVLVCGCADERKLAALAEPGAALRALARTRDLWRGAAAKLTVKTPSAALNRYLNGWAVYQALACRVLGRASLYQSGGAMGFRDQLQDAVNLLLIEPEIAKKQILANCAHQFTEGDVMHWWHALPGGDRGVRTRCSDDLLWLPWALCEYCEKTGDFSLCDEKSPWLCAAPLREGEEDRYDAFPGTEQADTVFEHALRALVLAFERGTGIHGLPFFGSGDWNDGMSAVKGESVWLGWFLSDTALRFSRLCARLGRDPGDLAARAEKMGKAADAAWDGGWYLRGWFQNGEPLGGEHCPACRIDSVAQSFGALSPFADPARSDRALAAALERLFDRENKLVRLFDPPFGDAGPDPGYIRGYGPGFRENGGQYTHAAVWLARACFQRKRPAEGRDILLALLPENKDAQVYRGEPFVIPADVYTNPDHFGEAGWTWYTGSAGWYYRVAVEELLGLRLEGGKLHIRPNLPPDWSGFDAELRTPPGKTLAISVGGGRITVNGAPWDRKGIPLN